MTKKELIEIMAQVAINHDYPKNDYNYQTRCDDYQIYKNIAKKSLEALCNALPESKQQMGYFKCATAGYTFDQEKYLESENLWRLLKDMGI